MKKNFKFYALIWAILLAAWCTVLFLVRPIIPWYVINYDARFWVAFTLIVATFIGNLVCAYFAFKAKNLRKMFLNLPLITVSWSTLIAMLAISGGLMLTPNCPAWFAGIACVAVLAFNMVTVIKAIWAADIVNKTEEKIKAQTLFIQTLTVDAESVLARAKSDAVKAECKRVYENIRYSDPMSTETLSVIEAKITVKMNELSAAVSADDAEKTKKIAGEIIILVSDRSKKCKLLK